MTKQASTVTSTHIDGFVPGTWISLSGQPGQPYRVVSVTEGTLIVLPVPWWRAIWFRICEFAMAVQRWAATVAQRDGLEVGR